MNANFNSQKTVDELPLTHYYAYNNTPPRIP